LRRKATRQSRAANEAEKAWMRKVKEMPCCVCGMPGPSIVDHIYGSTFRIVLRSSLERVLCGHWFVVPHCPDCDEIKTLGSRRTLEERIGARQIAIWIGLVLKHNWPVPAAVMEVARQLDGNAADG
jgi:hypothetical protein